MRASPSVADIEDLQRRPADVGVPQAASMAKGSVELRPIRYLIGTSELAIDETVDIRTSAVTP